MDTADTHFVDPSSLPPPMLLLLLRLTPARSSQQHLLLSQVYLHDGSQVLQLARVSQQSWKAAPHLEGGRTQLCEKYKADISCDSIMYVKATGECHMGTADPAAHLMFCSQNCLFFLLEYIFISSFKSIMCITQILGTIYNI